eukprot:1827039-Pleurochrysis_carterae.AAC.1
MMFSRPAALETSRPNGRRREGVRTFRYGPQSFRAPGRLGCRYRLRRALRRYRLCLYLLEWTRPPPLSHRLMNYNYKSKREECHRE